MKARFAITLSTLVSFFANAEAPVWPFRDFLGGAANAAFQVEGSPVESDWTRWTHEPGKIADGTNADRATDFWKRYDEDFALAAKLGANSFRISIAWERIEPRVGVFNAEALAHYETMIVAMRRHGLEPVVTLHHFVLPAWLADRGGLEAADFPVLFERYAERVVQRLAREPARVRLWMTFNEPMVLVHSGYLKGQWPPGHMNDAAGAMRAAANMARAHIRTVTRLRAANPETLWSVAAHWRDFQPVGGWLDGAFAKLSNWAFNQQFLDSIHTGKLLFWMPGSGVERERIALPGGRSTMDYVGVNYYGRMQVAFTPKPPFVVVSEGPGEKQDLGWEMYADGLDHVARNIHHRYSLPIFVTENGLADANDRWRAKFIDEHLAALRRARDSGIPVVGYLHWSLTDNFEWAEGLKPRFGLVEIDYASGARKPRPSFDKYRQRLTEWLRPSSK